MVAAAAVLVRRHAAAGLALDWPTALAWQAAVYGSWLPFALAAFLIARRWTGFRLRGAVGLYLAGVAATLAHAALATALDVLISPAVDAGDALRLLEGRAPVDLLVATALVAAAAATEAARRAGSHRRHAAALEAALADARAAAARQPAAPERLTVAVGGRRLLLAPSDVEWFGSAGNYVVVNWDGREGLLRETLSGLLDRLDPAVFARIHRTTAVNLSRVRETASLSDGSWRLVTDSGAELTASRTYRDAVLARLHGRA